MLEDQKAVRYLEQMSMESGQGDKRQYYNFTNPPKPEYDNLDSSIGSKRSKSVSGSVV